MLDNFNSEKCNLKHQSSTTTITTSKSALSTKGLACKGTISIKNEGHSVYDNNRREIWSCRFSPCGKLMAWCSDDGFVNILDYTQLNNINSTNTNVFLSNQDKHLIRIHCSEPAWSIAFGSAKTDLSSYFRDVHRRKLKVAIEINMRFKNLTDYLLLAIGLESGPIRIHDALTGAFFFLLCDHKDIVRDLRFTTNGSFQLASVSKDETIKLWDLTNDGNMYKTLKKHCGGIYACDWSPTAPFLCTVGINRQAFVWDMDSYEVKHTLKGHMHDVVTCQFSSDGGLLATGSFDTKIFIWDPYTGNPLRNFFHLFPPPRLIYASGHNEHYIRSLAFSKCNNYLVSISDDKKVKVWSLEKRTNQPVCESTHVDGVCCDYSPNGQTIIIGNRNGQISVYDAPTAVPSLLQICRKFLNKHIDHESIRDLHLPRELKNYLYYEELNFFNSNNSSSSSVSQQTIEINHSSLNIIY